MKLQSLLTNRAVLYIVLFLAVTNVLGLVTLNDNESILFFISVCIVAYYFTKNMIVILSTALIATNLLKTNIMLPYYRSEGMRNRNGSAKKTVHVDDDNEDTTEAREGFKNKKKDKEEADAADFLDSIDSDELKAKLEKTIKKMNLKTIDTVEDDEVPIDVNDIAKELVKKEMFSTNRRTLRPKQMKTSKTDAKKRGKNTTDDDDDEIEKGDYIDHAATLEKAYSNMERMLGNEGIKGLTNETMGLVKSQKVLAENMKNMEPMMHRAKSMLEGFNLDHVEKLINTMAGNKPQARA